MPVQPSVIKIEIKMVANSGSKFEEVRLQHVQQILAQETGTGRVCSVIMRSL